MSQKDKKNYWTEETELAVREYLENDFNFYQFKIDKHLEEVRKSIESNRSNPEVIILDVDEDFIDENQSKVDYTSRPEVIDIKNRIFTRKIYKPLIKLVESIIFSYKLFRSGMDVKTLHQDCMSFVLEKFCNFDPDLNNKSYSYYGTVTKHYLQNRKKDVDKETRISRDYDDHAREVDEKKSFELDEESVLDSSLALFKHIKKSLEGQLDSESLSKNDAKIADAIIRIFDAHREIGMYEKNVVYKMIKEITSLDTKDITYSLGRLKVFYKLRKKEFIKDHSDKYFNENNHFLSDNF